MLIHFLKIIGFWIGENKMQSVKILGVGKYLPEKIVDNNDMAKIVDTSDEWIVTRTGISTRHLVTSETTWEMGLKSAQMALDNSSLTISDIDVIIGVTSSPDFFYPSLSCIIAHQMGIKNPLTIDISCACSGFVYGLDLARRYLMDDDYNNVLLVCSETLSKQTDYTERSSCILFGDGSGSMVLTKGEGKFASILKSDQSGIKSLSCTAMESRHPWMDKEDEVNMNREYVGSKSQKIYMDGGQVYKFAVRTIPKVVNDVCAKLDMKPDDLDMIIMHQANLRIIEAAAKMMDIQSDKVFSNVSKYGNTSSASIPICFYEALEQERIKKGDKIGMVGFGGGLTYGACVLEIC